MGSTPLTSSAGRFRIRDLIPFGSRRHPRPRPFLEMLGIAWENRDQLGYAWRILNHGVCDGCSLGPRGLRDDVITGVHLCMTRLKLLRLNTMGPIPDGRLESVSALRALSNEDLRHLGRLPWPMIHRRGSDRLHRLSWDEALGIIGEALRDVPGERMGFFATSRGIVNETYYAFQKAARLMGSNHVDLCARLCHAASVAGLKDTLGVPAPTCSLKDLIGSDLVVIMGSHLSNNQPVTMKYLIYAKRQGTKILVVNPMREPGLERYWVPSDVRSALFGTRLMDDFFPVAVGGDIAFMTGVLKRLIEQGACDREFIAAHTTGFDALRAYVEALPWEALERGSGLERADMERFADTYARARTAVFVYSMGLTQHRFGVDNVKALVNLALARGMLGRERCGVLPIRGHSGVQGGGECGVDPDKYPGGFEVANPEDRRRFEELWGHPLPAFQGHRTLQMLEAASRGEIDFLYSLGGNLLETLPDREYMRAALARVGLRVHQDIVLNSSSLLEGDTVILLPAETRYETAGGGTATNTERRIRYSPEIPGPRIAEARPEWRIPVAVACAARPGLAKHLAWRGPGEIRDEMARAIPIYSGIEKLEREGQWVQWGGPRLFTDGFTRMPGGRARFTIVERPEIVIPEGAFHLATRRGKQFNSITWGMHDPHTGSPDRRDVFIHPEDAARIGVENGSRIRLRSEVGEWIGIARFGPIKARHLEAHWPEANALISRRFDPVSGEPDYNAIVTAEPAGADRPGEPPAASRTQGATAGAGSNGTGASAARLGVLALMIAGLVAPGAGARAAGTAPKAPVAQAPADTAWMAGLPEYQKLLDEFLVVFSKPGESFETRVDYIKLRFSEGRIERFGRIHRPFAASDPSRMNVTQRHAWAIDTYNFLVIEMITNNLLDNRASKAMRSHGLTGTPRTSVKQITIQDQDFFTAPAIAIGDSVYSLDQFERKFVFDGFRPGGKRPRTLDPRAHFALVCGAIGCPPLQPRAYTPDSLDAQLDRVTRAALANPRHLDWTPGLNSLKGSEIFHWYEADFGGPGKAFEFAARYAPDSQRESISKKPVHAIDDAIHWDWLLNSVPYRLTPALPPYQQP